MPMDTGPPIDHGWAWMCCLGAGMCMFFVTGGVRSAGLLFVEVVEVFDASQGLAAVTLGLLGAGFAFFAPLANAMGVRYTFRSVALIGAGFNVLAAFLTAFAPNIIYVICVLGIFTGIGYGLMMGPCLVVVGQHFRKRRSLANGIAASGGSIGQLVLPQLLTVLLANYGFQGALLIYSAICLHALPAAALFRPVSAYLTKSRRKKSSDVDDETNDESGALEYDIPDICPFGEYPFTEEDHLEPIPEEPEICPYDEGPVMENGSITPTRSSSVASLHEEPKTPKRRKAAKSSGSGSFLEWGLFKNWLFIIYALGLSFGNSGYINLCMFLPPYAISAGVSKQNAAILLSIVGISDLIGRLLGGWLADFGFMKRSNMIAISLIVTGGCAVLVPLSPSFVVLVAYSVVLGTIGGMYFPLMTVVAVDFLGISRLPSVFGLATLCFGMAIIPVPIIMGIVQDMTGSYNPAQWTCGTLMILGGISFALEPVARRLEGHY